MIAYLMTAAFSVGLAQAQQPPAKALDLTPHLNYMPAADVGADNGSHNLEKELVKTREKIVFVNGVQFKQIEYKGAYYRVNANQPETHVDCMQATLPQDTFAADSSVSVTKHTKFYLESLRQRCDPASNSIATSPDIRDSNLGIKFKGDSPDSTEKKIFVNPLRKMGGVGTDF